MSHWMQAINQEVPRDELVELQTVFCKIFDPDMSPLGFDAKEMYQFISERFNQNSIEVLRQALQWLQLLCLLNIPIPIDILFDMFNSGIETTLNAGPSMAPTEEPEDVNEDENKEVEGKPKLIVEVRSGGCVNPDDICSLARPLSSFSSGTVQFQKYKNTFFAISKMAKKSIFAPEKKFKTTKNPVFFSPKMHFW